jgi:signal peptide peptidase SppA
MLNLSSLNNTPWLIEPTRGEAMIRRLPELLSGGFPAMAEIEAREQAAAKRLKTVRGKLAVMRVHGVIEHRASLMSFFFGGFSTEMGGAVLDDYLNRKDIDAILLDVDSPGGSVAGVEEFSDKIYQGRSRKPIYAIANAEAYSAAYWIGTSASDFAVTPSGGAGSVGVYILHVEASKALEAAGYAVNFIRKPAFKAEANPYEALTDAAREHLQSVVDATYEKFVSAVARNRGAKASEVRANYGQGRTMLAKDALAAGMVDRIMSADELLAKLLGESTAASGRTRGEVDLLRMRADAARRKVVA